MRISCLRREPTNRVGERVPTNAGMRGLIEAIRRPHQGTTVPSGTRPTGEGSRSREGPNRADGPPVLKPMKAAATVLAPTAQLPAHSQKTSGKCSNNPRRPHGSNQIPNASNPDPRTLLPPSRNDDCTRRAKSPNSRRASARRPKGRKVWSEECAKQLAEVKLEWLSVNPMPDDLLPATRARWGLVSRN